MSILFPEKPKPVVDANEFLFSAVGLAHGHIYGMTHALLNAGATLCEVWDDSPQKVAAFLKVFPQAKAAPSLEAALGNPAVHLIASAAVPSERCALGIRVMRAGKDYFVDKAPMTSLDQLAQARHAVAETGRKYMSITRNAFIQKPQQQRIISSAKEKSVVFCIRMVSDRIV